MDMETTQHSRNYKKLIVEAQLSGKLILNNRKLKDVDLDITDDLSDVTWVDFSQNGLSEIPVKMSEWYCIKRLVLSQNSIKMIPLFMVNMRLLQFLDLSNNLLEAIPPSLCELQHLNIIRLNNNKLTSCPIEIGNWKKCQELDLGGNFLKNLPEQIGDLDSLMYFDVSDNYLSDFPEHILNLKLIYLNASSNNIQHIPSWFQNMTSIKELYLHDNPLIYPSSRILKQGRVHFFKSLKMKVKLNQNSLENFEPVLSIKESFNTNINSSSISSLDKIDTPDKTSPQKAKPDFNEEADEVITGLDEVLDNEPIITAEKNNSPKKVKSPPSSPTKSSPKRKTSPVKKLDPIRIKPSSFPGYFPQEKPADPNRPHFLQVIKPRTASHIKHGPDELSFTMRRRTEKIYEELELLESLRERLETSLKMPLPNDLLPALSDGVVLCHLANHIKARSIPTIHVPSPAVPKLTLAKSRRNVDNFLDACVKLGVNPKIMCTANDIMHERGLVRLADTVKKLLKIGSSSNSKTSTTAHSFHIAPST